MTLHLKYLLGIDLLYNTPSQKLVGWQTGLEPATPGTTNQCSNQLSYNHHNSKQQFLAKSFCHSCQALYPCFLLDLLRNRYLLFVTRP